MCNFRILNDDGTVPVAAGKEVTTSACGPNGDFMLTLPAQALLSGLHRFHQYKSYHSLTNSLNQQPKLKKVNVMQTSLYAAITKYVLSLLYSLWISLSRFQPPGVTCRVRRSIFSLSSSVREPFFSLVCKNIVYGSLWWIHRATAMVSLNGNVYLID